MYYTVLLSLTVDWIDYVMAPRMTAALVWSFKMLILMNFVFYLSKVFVPTDTDNGNNSGQMILSLYIKFYSCSTHFIKERLNHRRLTAPIQYHANSHAIFRLDMRKTSLRLELVKDGDVHCSTKPRSAIYYE